MIFVKQTNLLTNCERTLITALILSCFEKSRLSTYDTVIWCEEDKRIIGFMGYHTKQYDDPVFGHITILNQLCVDENHRCKGIATDLLRYTEATQQTTLILYIDKYKPHTDKLYEFYKKHGYKNIDQVDKHLPHRSNIRYLPDIEYLMIKPKKMLNR